MVGRGGDIWAERSREEMWGKREREEDELDKGEQGDDRRGGTEVRCYLDARDKEACQDAYIKGVLRLSVIPLILLSELPDFFFLLLLI